MSKKASKKKFSFGRVLLIILAVIVIFALFLVVNGTCPHRGHRADDLASEWMARIPDDTLIKEIAMPGSHDAGTYEMVWLGRTQNYSLYDQLNFGARYFDIRVNKTEKGYPIYHSIINGTEFQVVLSDIKRFIKACPSEVLLLDFQHFSGGSRDDVFRFLTEGLASEDLVLCNKTGVSDVEFISALTLGQCRGKCIVFFGETDDASAYADWVFLRNNDDCSKANMCLDSCYLGDAHKSGFKTLTEEAHPVYFKLLEKKQQAGEDGIFVLQCQLTDGKLIFGPWSAERGQEKKMGEYVRALAKSPDIKGINVVMRDFLTPEKCEDIINLNRAKGLLK